MSLGRNSHSCLIEEVTDQHLVTSVTSANTTSPHSNNNSYLRQFSRNSCFKNLRSKGGVLILLWNVIIGLIYGLSQSLADAAFRSDSEPFKYSEYQVLGILGCFTLGQMLLYPLGGLLADLWFGRYKIIISSGIMITFGFVFVFITATLFTKHPEGQDGKWDKIVNIFFGVVGMLLLLLGFSGFQSNAVQFGLDQFMEAPSEDLSVFLHWFVWTKNLGEMFTHVAASALLCNKNLINSLKFLPLIFAVMSGVLLLLTLHKRKWFHCEPRTRNPYGLIYKVLQFVVKHKVPLQRSAFTFSDDIIPNRMDYAKTRFGGPFTTEVVEDVKTFLRIILMLCFITPSAFYSIIRNIIFVLYGLHMGEHTPINSNKCTANWLVLQSGNLTYMVTVTVIPLYIFLIHPHSLKWVPRILHRLCVSVLILTVSVCVMSVLYTTALSRAASHHIETTCIFLAEYRNKEFSETLHFPVLYLIIPNILSGIAYPFMNITILEFISAQCPHSMKGLMLGMFYAIRGVFILFGTILIFPFTTMVFEKDRSYSLFKCGFFYFFLNAVLSVVFLAVVLRATLWYKFREREEKPYSHAYVEEYYRHYATRRDSTSIINKRMQAMPQINDGIPTYGSIDET